jgi:hypothetical protein
MSKRPQLMACHSAFACTSQRRNNVSPAIQNATVEDDRSPPTEPRSYDGTI